MITREQSDKIIAITDADCDGRGYLLDRQGYTCAVGALLLAAGAPKWIIQGKVSPNHSESEILFAEYGLCLSEIHAIMDRNDKHDTPGWRRYAVRRYVRSLVGGNPE